MFKQVLFDDFDSLLLSSLGWTLTHPEEDGTFSSTATKARFKTRQVKIGIKDYARRFKFGFQWSFVSNEQK